MDRFSHITKIIVFFSFIIFLIGFLGSIFGCGNNSREISDSNTVDEILEQALEESKNIKSAHVDISSNVIDNGKILREMTRQSIDMNGGDYYYKGFIYYLDNSGDNVIILENIKVGETEYYKFSGEDWMKGTASTFDLIEGLSNRIFLSPFNTGEVEGAQYVDVEEVKSIEVHIKLSSDDISELVVANPDSELPPNDGGEMDIWITEDTHYPYRYEIRAFDCEIENYNNLVDVSYIYNLSNLNESIEIIQPI